MLNLLKSRTIVGALAMAVGGLLHAFGVPFAEGDEQTLQTSIAALFDAVGFVLVLVGRIKAKGPIALDGSARIPPAGALLLALLLPAALGACASIEAKTPAQRIYALQADYNALLAVAVAYESRPRCAGPPRLDCSDPGAVAEIRKADTDAHAVLRAAQAVARTPGASPSNLIFASAHAAIDALRKILVNRGILIGA